MNKPVQEIFPELSGLTEEDAIPAPLKYEPLLAALAHEVIVAREDPPDDEGHRYFLLAGGPKRTDNFGVLIFARYFDDDPCLEGCTHVYEAQEVCDRVARKIYWSPNFSGAILRIRQVLKDRLAGHGQAAQDFLAAVSAITADRIKEVLHRKWERA